MADEAKKQHVYRNVHTAPVGDLAPGAEGPVDPENAGIKIAIEAGQLVPMDGSHPSKALADLQSENAALKRRVQELEASAASALESRATVDAGQLSVEGEAHKQSEPGSKSRRG